MQCGRRCVVHGGVRDTAAATARGGKQSAQYEQEARADTNTGEHPSKDTCLKDSLCLIHGIYPDSLRFGFAGLVRDEFSARQPVEAV